MSQPSGPAPFPTAPDQPVPAQPVRKNFFARHKILTAVLVLVGIGIATQAASGDDPAPTPGAAQTASAPADGAPPGADPAAPAEPAAPVEEEPAPAAPGVGTPVADGKFEFTVTNVEQGVGRVGSDMFGEDAQGQFLLVHVTVRNVGDEAQYFDSSSQKLVDAQGRQHSADSAAAIYLDGSSFLESVNPGNSVEGIVVFDVPVDAVPATLELHDSMFSDGVTVTLG